MTAIVLTLASWAGELADPAIVGQWLKAAATDDPTGKYMALTRGLTGIDAKQYTRKRADVIGVLYGSLLGQDVPARVKHHVCRALAKMDGLDASVDALLRWAGTYKAAAAGSKQRERSAFKAVRTEGVFRTGPPWPDEERLADELIAALWTQKSGGGIL